VCPPELWPLVCRLGGFVSWPPSGSAEIDRFFKLAQRQGVFGLLMADSELPAEMMGAKSRHRMREAVDRLRFQRSAAAIQSLQDVLGVENVLLFKGADLRHRLYAAPHVRQMADVDILVKPGTYGEVLQRLERSGYPRQRSKSVVSRAAVASEATVVVGGVEIDVHRNFIHGIRAKLDYDAIWSRRERFEQDGVAAYRFAPSDALLTHALSPLAIDEFCCAIVRYVDFYLLLDRYANEIEACVARARQWGIEHALFGALHVTSMLFPSVQNPAISNAMEQLASRATRRLLVNHVLPDTAARSCAPPLSRGEQLWRKFWLIDSFWRRIAFVIYHCYELASGSLARLRKRDQLENNCQGVAEKSDVFRPTRN